MPETDVLVDGWSVPRTPMRRRLIIVLIVVVAVALVVVVDWPHRATAGQLRADYSTYATQVRGDIQSCSTEVEETLSAYNQITAGAVTDRATAIAIANQTALDCTPLGNSRIDDLGTLQPPASLDRFSLAGATQSLYAWAFPSSVDVAHDISRLLAKPGDPAALSALKQHLTQMSTDAAAAQQTFDQAAASVGLPPFPFGLDEVRPSVVVG